MIFYEGFLFYEFRFFYNIVDNKQFKIDGDNSLINNYDNLVSRDKKFYNNNLNNKIRDNCQSNRCINIKISDNGINYLEISNNIEIDNNNIEIDNNNNENNSLKIKVKLYN